MNTDMFALAAAGVCLLVALAHCWRAFRLARIQRRRVSQRLNQLRR